MTLKTIIGQCREKYGYSVDTGIINACFLAAIYLITFGVFMFFVAVMLEDYPDVALYILEFVILVIIPQAINLILIRPAKKLNYPRPSWDYD